MDDITRTVAERIPITGDNNGEHDSTGHVPGMGHTTVMSAAARNPTSQMKNLTLPIFCGRQYHGLWGRQSEKELLKQKGSG